MGKEIRSNWWQEKENLHSHIKQYTECIKQAQFGRYQANILYALMYGNADSFSGALANFGFKRYSETLSKLQKEERLRLNIVRSCVDTLTAKITKNRTKPMFLPVGGDFDITRRAKNLNRYIEAIFLNADVYKNLATCFRDCALFSVGALKIYQDGNKIKSERIWPNELIVDDVEALYGMPRQLHQQRLIAKETLAFQFPKNKNEIFNAVSPTLSLNNNFVVNNMLEVTESWHLPQIDEEGIATDGRHCITTDTITLLDEEWTQTDFPIVLLRLDDPLLGFWGQGLAEQLYPIQTEINRLLKRIQQSMYRVGVPRIYIRHGSKINTEQLSNEIASIVYYTGAAPIFETPATVSPETFTHLRTLKEDAYSISGISQLSAQAKKPAGLTSGVALNTFHDIESERFMTVGMMFEQAHIEIAKRVIGIASDIYEQYGEFPVLAKKGNSMERLDWSQVSLDQDDYQIQIWPVALFPSTPAGKLEKVGELMDRGLIQSREDALKLLDLPDLERVSSLITANDDIIEKIIPQILDGEEPEPPESLMGLEAGIQKMTMEYLKVRTQNVEEEKLQHFLNWIAQAQNLLAQAQAPIQEAPPLMAPPSAPMPETPF